MTRVLTADEYRHIVEGCADIAISTGAAVVHIAADVVIVPDTLAIQAFANGEEDYRPPSMTRADGRSIWLYALPDVMSLIEAEAKP